MAHIKEIVSTLLSELQKGEKKPEKKIFTHWVRIVGDTIANHTKPYKIKKKVLLVMVDDATWVYELSQKHKQQMIVRINNECSEGTIEDIYFSVGIIK
jgi:predicted nucleic acid-binding Zn ribbon protein